MDTPREGYGKWNKSKEQKQFLDDFTHVKNNQNEGLEQSQTKLVLEFWP